MNEISNNNDSVIQRVKIHIFPIVSVIFNILSISGIIIISPLVAKNQILDISKYLDIFLIGIITFVIIAIILGLISKNELQKVKETHAMFFRISLTSVIIGYLIFGLIVTFFIDLFLLMEIGPDCGNCRVSTQQRNAQLIVLITSVIILITCLYLKFKNLLRNDEFYH